MKPSASPPLEPTLRGLVLRAFPRVVAILALGSALGFTFNAANPLGVRWEEAPEPVLNPSPPPPPLLAGSANAALPVQASPATAAPPPPAQPVPAAAPPVPAAAPSVVTLPPPPDSPTNGMAHVNAPSQISWAEAKLLLQENKIVLVDARSRPAYDAGHIPGAICLPEDSAAAELEAFRSRYGTNAHVVVYCSSTSCSLSFKLAYKLAKDYGFNRTQFMTGGYFEYQREAGLADSNTPPAVASAPTTLVPAVPQVASGTTTVRVAVPAPGTVSSVNPEPMSWAKVPEWILQRQALLVDARSSKAFEAGHVPGAVSLPSDSTAAAVAAFRQEYGTNRTLIVYGDMGGSMRAFLAGRQLMREAGFASVRFVTEGFKEWQAMQAAPPAP